MEAAPLENLSLGKLFVEHRLCADLHASKPIQPCQWVGWQSFCGFARTPNFCRGREAGTMKAEVLAGTAKPCLFTSSMSTTVTRCRRTTPVSTYQGLTRRQRLLSIFFPMWLGKCCPTGIGETSRSRFDPRAKVRFSSRFEPARTLAALGWGKPSGSLMRRFGGGRSMWIGPSCWRALGPAFTGRFETRRLHACLETPDARPAGRCDSGRDRHSLDIAQVSYVLVAAMALRMTSRRKYSHSSNAKLKLPDLGRTVTFCVSHTHADPRLD